MLCVYFLMSTGNFHARSCLGWQKGSDGVEGSWMAKPAPSLALRGLDTQNVPTLMSPAAASGSGDRHLADS